MTQRKFKAAQWFIAILGEHPRRLFLVSAGILAAGFIWHLISILIDPASKTQAFPRSGSLLVIFAIATVFFNHVLSTIKKNTEASQEKISWLTEWPRDRVVGKVRRQTEAHIEAPLLANTLNHNPNFFEDSADSLIRQGEGLAEQNQAKIEQLSGAEINLGYTEAGAGITGTFVWGYGDIIFDLLYQIGFFLMKAMSYILNSVIGFF